MSEGKKSTIKLFYCLTLAWWPLLLRFLSFWIWIFSLTWIFFIPEQQLDAFIELDIRSSLWYIVNLPYTQREYAQIHYFDDYAEGNAGLATRLHNSFMEGRFEWSNRDGEPQKDADRVDIVLQKIEMGVKIGDNLFTFKSNINVLKTIFSNFDFKSGKWELKVSIGTSCVCWCDIEAQLIHVKNSTLLTWNIFQGTYHQL